MSVRNIAIVGGTGQLGSRILDALISANRFSITAVTRSDSSATFPTSVKIQKGNYDDDGFFERALEGQDVLILALAFLVPQDLQKRLITAAAKSKVPWILPNEFGSDGDHPSMSLDVPMYPPKIRDREVIQALATSSWIGVINNPWLDYSLPGGFFGIDIKGRSATLYDEGTTKFNTSTLSMVGKAVAGILSLPLAPEKGGAPSLSDYQNRFAYVRSFHTSQREILDAVQLVTGTTDKDWNMKQQEAQDWISEGFERVKSGDMFGGINILYGYHFKKGMGGDFEHKVKVNDVIDLPKENLVEEVKKVIANMGS